MNFRLPDLFFLVVFGLFSTAAFAAASSAPLGDQCVQAIKLADVTDWCSSPRQFTNAGATASGVDNPVCFPSYQLEADNDVWFQFAAVATTAHISVIGALLESPKGTLQFPQLALYRGGCGSLQYVACLSDARGYHIAETFVNSLTVGATYYLRVDGRNSKSGTFQLCVNNYNPVPSPSSDCSSGVVLCDKSSFTVPSVQGAGSNSFELTGGMCLPEESSSAWYKWTCEKTGSLTFTLRPVNPGDDLDFALFLLPNGPKDCSMKVPLRCMAAGENVNEPYAKWAPCTGSTGLRAASTDIQEDRGCDEGSDNFLAPLGMESGKSYALLVNNYHNTGNGFSIEFGGTGTFAGPKAHFTVSKLKIEKDKPLTIKNASEFSGGIVKWEWNFGVGAKPQSATGQGPHSVVYSSAGKKTITLSIQTGNGCKVSKGRNIEVVVPPPAPKLDAAVEKKKEKKVEEKAAPPAPPSPSPKPEASAEKKVEKKPEEKPAEPAPPAPDGEATASTEAMPPQDILPPPAKLPPSPLPPDTIREVKYSVKYEAVIFYKADSFTLVEKDYQTLEKVLGILLENSEHLAIVEGHTNHIPDEVYCLKLSARRADAVIGWLESKGVENQRIVRKVFGKEKVASVKNRRVNQRVEIKIVRRDE